MITEELVKRSPLRILERSTHGGIGKGNVGVFAGPKGVGKTACLVHIATDRLLQGKHVIHVSFSDDTSHIEAWYEDIFKELAGRYQLDGAMEAHDSIIRNRVITKFEQDAVQWPRVESTIRSLMENAAFSADTVVIDGYGFPTADVEAFSAFRQFAAEVGLEVWLSASVGEPAADAAVPTLLTPYLEECAVVIVLVDKGTYIHLELIKDHGNPIEDVHLKLDPQILLIAEED
ncbi:MAG: AAA family ATPase [Chitinivibrionales bacterium]|nr:AAA family ATPase [Chitinivibrionales bacterium]